MPSSSQKIRSSLRYLSGRSGAKWDAAAAQSGFTAVLCYHRVLETPPPANLFDVERGISAELFEQQLRFMLRYFKPVRPSHIATDPAPGVRQFAITFDDGCEDNYSVAAPILERLGLSAAFFVVQDFIGQDRRFWWETLGGILRETTATSADLSAGFSDDVIAQFGPMNQIALRTLDDKAAAQRQLMNALNAQPHHQMDAHLAEIAGRLGVTAPFHQRDFALMDLAQLKDLIARGFDIGGHTASHCNLGLGDADAIATEVVTATHDLERDLGTPITTFAYPYGRRQHMQMAAIEALKNTNVKLAFTTEGGVISTDSDAMALPRFQLNNTYAPVWAYNIDKALAVPAFKAEDLFV